MSQKIVSRFPASRDKIEGARINALGAVAARRELEVKHPDNGSMLRFLDRERKEWQTCDAMTLEYIAHHGICLIQWYTHSRHGGELYNIYAMPKTRLGMRILNGSYFDSLADSDTATLVGSILALHAAGGSIDGKSLAFALNDFMNTTGKRRNYGSGATQSGSSMRALEALGIVSKDGTRVWKVINKEHFAFLVAAARKASGM